MHQFAWDLSGLSCLPYVSTLWSKIACDRQWSFVSHATAKAVLQVSPKGSAAGRFERHCVGLQVDLDTAADIVKKQATDFGLEALL
jgi:hypothetical protein